MYFLLPETEDRTLEDIEMHFSDNKRKLTDRKIQKNVTAKQFNGPAAVDCDKSLKEVALANANGAERKPSMSLTVVKIADERKDSQENGHTNNGFVSDNN